MKIITDDRCTRYAAPEHPERPARIKLTVQKLKNQTDLPITWAAPAPIDDGILLRAHTAEHLARLAGPEDFDGDTPFFPGIGDYARASAGAALEALKTARAGESGFSLKPPHAHQPMRDPPTGFCYPDNIAIAA